MHINSRRIVRGVWEEQKDLHWTKEADINCEGRKIILWVWVQKQQLWERNDEDPSIKSTSRNLTPKSNQDQSITQGPYKKNKYWTRIANDQEQVTTENHQRTGLKIFKHYSGETTLGKIMEQSSQRGQKKNYQTYQSKQLWNAYSINKRKVVKKNCWEIKSKPWDLCFTPNLQ